MDPTPPKTDDKPKRPEIATVKADDYKAFYAHVMFGGFHGNYHFRLDFANTEGPPVEYVEMPNGGMATPDGRVTRVVQASAFMSLPALKELAVWLAQRVKAYEDQFGAILPGFSAPLVKPADAKGG